MRNLIILFIIYIIPTTTFALIEVDITRGNLNPLPIAVSPLSIDEDSKKKFKNILKKGNIGSEISLIVEKNLKTSGLFNPLKKEVSEDNETGICNISMIDENYDDAQTLKDIFLKSLELADPAKKLEKISKEKIIITILLLVNSNPPILVIPDIHSGE